MDGSIQQIEERIEATRGDLGNNLQELEEKVRAYADWKTHFQNSPFVMLGMAFTAGIVLSSAFGSPRRSLRSEAPAKAREALLHAKSSETWNVVKGALIGVAASRIKDLVGEMVPGFKEELQRAETKGTRA